jgi:predicted  nucleic acid-binding Zn-ribbon protein
MNQDLRSLIRLQELMNAIADLQERQAAVPVEVARLEKELLAFEAEVEKEKTALSELQKERRHLEMELMGVETRMQKYQGQLAEVKTNKEYQAMLHEIEACKAERSALDEKILLDMDAAEKTQAAARVHDERLRDRRQETERGKQALGERMARLQADRERLEADRDALQKSIPSRMLDPFLKVSKQRKGLGLVPVRGELCGGCHVRVMPKLIQEIRRSASLITCDSCKRFLYVFEDLIQGAAGLGDPASPPPDAPLS